jgi:hypothetical protein
MKKKATEIIVARPQEDHSSVPFSVVFMNGIKNPFRCFFLLFCEQLNILFGPASKATSSFELITDSGRAKLVQHGTSRL